METRVLVAYVNGIIRAGIRSLLEKQPGIEVDGETDNGRRTLKLTAELQPDVVLMDLELTDMTGIEATRIIASRFPRCGVLIFSAQYDRKALLEALRAGAKGLVMTSCTSIEEITCAVRTVAAGRHYVSPAVTESIISDYKNLRAMDTLHRKSSFYLRKRGNLKCLK